MSAAANNDLFIVIVSEDDFLIDKVGEALIGNAKLDNDQVAAASPKNLTNCDLKNPPSHVFIDMVKSSPAQISDIDRIRNHFTNAVIATLGIPTDSQYVVGLVKAGVEHFLNYPLEADDLNSVLKKKKQSEHQNWPSHLYGHTGSIIAFSGPKGGSGVTLLASNIAATLAEKMPSQVLITELASQCGDIASYLDVDSKYNLKHVIDKHDQLDKSYLQGVITKHPSGLHILSGPDLDQDPLNSSHLKELQSVLYLLKHIYKVIIIDTANADPGLVQLVWMQTDIFFLIGNLDIPSLKGMTDYYNKLLKLGYNPDNIRIILNRYNAKFQLNVKEFEKNICHPIACNIPNDYSLCIESVNSGITLKDLDSNAPMTKIIEEMAQGLLNNSESHTPQSRSRSLSNWVSKIMKG